MTQSWSSRDRLLAAINCQEPDRVPLWCNWYNVRELPTGKWRDQVERVEVMLKMGLDDSLMLWQACDHHVSRVGNLHPALVGTGVKVSFERQVSPDQPYPLLIKEYDTPMGQLRQVVKQTEDWTAGEDVHIIDDMNMPRSLEFIVNKREHLSRLAYLFPPPTRDEISAFRAESQRLKEAAHKHDVLFEGGWIAGSDLAMWLAGPVALLTAAYDDPGYVQELLELIWQFNRPQIELMLEAKVDTVVHRGWYDTTRFWSPKLYRQFLKPLLQREIDLVHSGGAKFTYIMSSGIMPLLDDFVEMGIDVLWGVDPVQGDADLPMVKQKLGGKVCVWGGMNSCVTLELGTKEDVEQAVTDAIRILGPGGGLVLFPVDNMFDYTPWHNTTTMIERWREISSYPIKL